MAPPWRPTGRETSTSAMPAGGLRRPLALSGPEAHCHKCPTKRRQEDQKTGCYPGRPAHASPWHRQACSRSRHLCRADASHSAEELQDARNLIQRQQSLVDGRPYDVREAQRLVEVAMLAAIGGLAYLLSTLLKLQSYIGYLLPMPVLVAALRLGLRAAPRTVAATCCLLLVLLGPVQAMTYLLTHGLTAGVMAATWVLRVPWALSIPACALIRVLGTLGYLVISSWTLRENLFALLMANVFSLLDQLQATIGIFGAPSPTVVTVVIGSLLIVNAAAYVVFLHLLYVPFLRGMGYKGGNVPGIIERHLEQQNSGMVLT